MDPMTFVEGVWHLSLLVGAGFLALLTVNISMHWYLDKIRDELKALKK